MIENNFPDSAGTDGAILPGTPAAHLVRRMARRINGAAYLSAAAVPVAVVLIAFAVAYLFAQMLAPSYSRYTFAVLFALPVALVWAWVRCQRHGRFFTTSQVVELTDHLSESDGLAVTAFERPFLVGGGQAWDRVGSRVGLHRLRLDGSWFAWRLVPAMAFATAVFFVPPRKPELPPNMQMMASLAQPLDEKLKMSTELLPEAEREKLEEQMEQLQNGDNAVTREKWEAMESVEQQLENALAQSDAAAQQLSKSLDEMADLLSQQAKASSPQESAALQSQMEALAKSVESQLGNKSSSLNKSLKEQLKSAMGKCKAGKCSGSELDELRKNSSALSDKLAKMMKEGKNPSSVGSGGVGRGRADAALTFGEEHRLDEASFEPSQLQNQYFDEESLTDLGMTTVEPKADPGVFKPGTVKQFAAPEGSNVSRTQISPGQRGVVSRYFE